MAHHKNSCWKLQIEILTPVHIGTGRELFFDRDYIVDGNRHLLVIDQNALFEELAAMEISDGELKLKIDQLVSNINLNELVKISGKKEGYLLGRFSNNIVFDEVKGIREAIKDGFFRPYLPGSSIKGAIRTALLAELVLEKETNGKSVIDNKKLLPDDGKSETSASKKLSNYLFSRHAPKNKEPNYDFLRALHVSDVILKNPELVLADVRWLNLIGKDENHPIAQWRPVGKDKQSVEKWEDATGIFIESISERTTGELTLQVDNFLFEEAQAQSELQWEYVAQHFSNFEALKNLLNQHAEKRLTKEMRFFDKAKNTKAREQCEQMTRRIKQDSEVCYLQIGWGNGWEGITGGWMDNEIKDSMREKYRLGKQPINEYKVFPKTRRLIVHNGQPCLPLGWVRILPENYTISLKKVWVDKEIHILKTQSRFDDREALFSKQLAERWARLEDALFKAQVLEEIKDRWKTFYKDVDWWEKDVSSLSGAMKKAKKIYEKP